MATNYHLTGFNSKPYFVIAWGEFRSLKHLLNTKQYADCQKKAEKNIRPDMYYADCQKTENLFFTINL